MNLVGFYLAESAVFDHFVFFLIYFSKTVAIVGRSGRTGRISSGISNTLILHSPFDLPTVSDQIPWGGG